MMPRNFKTALRSLLKQKSHSILNILGIAIGLASTFLLTIWILDEISYDLFHEKGSQIYRVMRHVYSGDQIETSDRVTWNIANELKERYPEVEDVAVITPSVNLVLDQGELSVREWGRYVTDNFFEMFSWRLIQGEPSNVLQDKKSVVISKSLAQKYFGNDWQHQAVGSTIHDNVNNIGDLTVTGVFEDLPLQSSLQFDFVLPIDIFVQNNNWLFNWNNSGIHIFTQIREGAAAAELSEKVTNIQNDHIEQFRSDLFLQAYTDQHLHSGFKDGKLVGGRIEYVRIFSGVAIIILLIACINFMNLSIAHAMRRAREIGVRKAVGAGKWSLVKQFMGESFMLVFIAFVLAMAIVATFLPFFNDLTGKSVTIARLAGNTFLKFTGIGVLTALFAGFYPAFYLSSFDTVRILRGTFRLGGRSVTLRKGLVIFQFAISILLIFGTIIVYQQINYIHAKNIGLDRDNVIYFPLEGQLRTKFGTVMEALRRKPGIAAVTSTDSSPLDIGSNTHSVSWKGKDPESQISLRILSVNFDFLDVMKIELAAGRGFHVDFETDKVNYLVNQKALEVMGFQHPLGERLTFWGNTGEIVGVVRDFHMSSFYSEIAPTIIQLRPGNTRWIYLRTEPGRTKEALAGVEEIFRQFNPEYPFEYNFLDESFRQMYRSEMVIGKLATYFAAIALFIACLGLFGLAVYAAQRRVKEIGIRKVLGATAFQIVTMLNKDFVILVIIGFLITLPFAWYWMDQWLQNFAYRIEINGFTYLLAGLAAIALALLTISWQAISSALKNPVDSLRDE